MYCVAAASKVWPIIDGDGPAYFPAAVEWSLGRPLTNPVWPPPLNDTIDGPGGRRFIYHGFLYPILVGGAARLGGGGAEATVAAAYVLHWLTAVIGAVAVLTAFRLSGVAAAIAAALLPPSMLALSIAWHGRVEPLALLIVALAVLAWRLRKPLREFAIGGLCGALVFTSPACGVLGILLAGAAFATDRNAGLRSLAQAVAGLVGAALAAIVIYPYPIGDWIGGVSRHSRINLSLPSGQGFVQTWLAAPELPLLGVTVVVLAALSAIGWWTLTRDASMRRRASGGLLVLGFAVGLTRVAFVKTEASYNAVVWIPVLAAAAVAGLSAPRGAWIPIAVLGLPVIGIARSSLVLAAQFQPGAVSFRDARARIEPLVAKGASITPGLWLAAGNHSPIVLAVKDGPSETFFVRQESKTGIAAPPEYPGFALTVNEFRPGARFLGLPLARTAGGWEFAVYERKPRE